MDKKKTLKERLRRAKTARILHETAVREFLGGFIPELCGRFDEEFGGEADNI